MSYCKLPSRVVLNIATRCRDRIQDIRDLRAASIVEARMKEHRGSWWYSLFPGLTPSKDVVMGKVMEEGTLDESMSLLYGWEALDVAKRLQAAIEATESYVKDYDMLVSTEDLEAMEPYL